MEEEWILRNFSSVLDDNKTYNLEKILGPKRNSLYVVIPITVIYAIIFLSGLIGNVSTCIVIAKNKSMHTATNYYLFNLAISDLLLLVSGLPQEMYSIWSRYPDVFGSTFCVLRGLFSETSANATVLTITAFTVERYVAICHPFLSHTLAKLSRIVKLILAIWIVAVCFAIPQALQFGVARYIEDVPESDMCQAVNPIMKHSFEVSTFLFFVAPMTLITVLYVLIGIRLRNSTNMMKKECGESSRYQGSSSSCPSRKITNRPHSSQSSRRVLKMLVAVVVAFFICWAPFHAQRLIAIYMTPPEDGERSVFLKIYEIATYISGILYYVSTTINPLLYNIMSNKFREAFKETFSRCCRLSRARVPQRSYSVLSRSAQRGPDSTDSGRDDPTLHTNTTLIHRNSVEPTSPYATAGRRSNRKSAEKPDSFDSDKGIVTFTWNADRSDIRFTMAPKSDYENVRPNTKLVAVHVPTLPQTRLNKFMQFFQCIAKKTLDDGKRLTTYYSPNKENNTTAFELEQTNKLETYSVTSGEISNSSLKNVDHASLEDELAAYMWEVQNRTSSQLI